MDVNKNRGAAVPPRKGKQSGRPGQGARSPGKVANPQRAAATRAAERRRRIWWAGGAVVAVVAIVAVVVGVGLSSGSPAPAPRVLLSADVQNAVTHVPLPTLVQASSIAGSQLQPAKQLTGAPLTSGGKPEILYIGAEFCPICAAQRWPMVVALSHFGSFTNLSSTRSAVHDGNIGTFSFYGSTYTSPYLVFTPVETTTNVPQGNYYQTLETPTAEQQALWSSLLGGQESFPFVDIGGKYLLSTAQYSPTLVLGKSFEQIASQVGNNSTTVGVTIDAAAAAFIKYVCAITGQKPAATCRAVANVTAPVSSSPSGPSSSSG